MHFLTGSVSGHSHSHYKCLARFGSGVDVIDGNTELGAVHGSLLQQAQRKSIDNSYSKKSIDSPRYEFILASPPG